MDNIILEDGEKEGFVFSITELMVSLEQLTGHPAGMREAIQTIVYPNTHHIGAIGRRRYPQRSC